MTCPRCQQENPGDAVFCQECGTRLEAACPSCGTPNQLGAKFCKKCGQRLSGPQAEPAMPGPRFGPPESYTPKHLAEKILTSKAALEGERKQVTVLFADLKGSMELLADRDPEEARKLLDPVLERMMEAVHRYEGTVNQVMGDGIMALFGAPVAHEDHAVRACYAALRMQDAVRRYAEELRRGARRRGPDPRRAQLRRGRRAGDRERSAHGLHAPWARRRTSRRGWSSSPRPGSIRITADTLGLAEGYVEVKPLGPVPVKGLGDAGRGLRAGRDRHARGRLQAAARRDSRASSGATPRSSSCGEALEKAARGHGQVVAMVGRAGRGEVPALLGVRPIRTGPTAGSWWSAARSPTGRRPRICRSSTSSRATSAFRTGTSTARSGRR